MQTLKLFISLPDATHPELELHLSTSNAQGEVVIALPGGTRVEMVKPAVAQANMLNAVNDDYERGGYAGI